MKSVIKNYKKFLVNVGESGVYKNSMVYSDLFCTLDKYGLYISHVPNIIEPGIKEPVTQDWPDEDGEDTFLNAYVKSEAYDLEVEFATVRNDGNAVIDYKRFIAEIRGKWLQLYDEYSGLGRNAAYLRQCDKEPTYKRRNNREVLIAKVLFRVNDPNTDVKLILPSAV